MDTARAVQLYLLAKVADESVGDWTAAQVMSAHGFLAWGHLILSYRFHKVWQHQLATNAHRRARRLWKSAQGPNDGAMSQAVEATHHACALTMSLVGKDLG